ncbi:dTDP-glucose 4,6-dehydratase [Halobacteriovorax sp. HLS]|uniref:dTDP-glucose 4,6-dehydratase n=1 Tax=Halobacteriovorax sp. HLS TaxID=2234000 RepID=UPI000FDCD0D1|nr:dTDP-glucose 4,6-dehydratase [Halobacteriovorax sp. HLS]
MKNILITGGAGFIGSNFIIQFMNEYPEYNIINFDKLTYAGNLDNLNEITNKENYHFVEGDICERNSLEDIFSKYDITDIIHFAAESHVDNSIEGPECFINTNIQGTFNLLDVARKKWMNAPFSYRKEYEKSKFHHISTDEVYGALGETGLFSETTPYAPNSPYSASKASSDMIARSYFHTYGLSVVTTNCSNNYGPRQHNEKLIPTIIRKAIALEPIPIYGDGKNIRDWLYVDDHCHAIAEVFHKGRLGETYCVGGECERTNLEVVSEICNILQELKPSETKYEDLITFVKDRPGHDQRYAIDITKIKTELKWTPKENFNSGLIKTLKWYLNATE